MVASARTYQKWSAALIRRMTRLADRGMSAARIAKALGLTRGQVLGKMHHLGLKTKNLPRRWLNTALVEKMAELAGQRLSLNQIGKALGRSEGARPEGFSFPEGERVTRGGGSHPFEQIRAGG